MKLSDFSELSPQPSAPLLPQQYLMSHPAVPPLTPQMMPPLPMGSPYVNPTYPGYQGYPAQKYSGYQGQQSWPPPHGQQQAWSPQQQQPWSPASPQQQPPQQQQQPRSPPHGQQLPLSEANQFYPTVYQSAFPPSGEHPPSYHQLFGSGTPQSGLQVHQPNVEVAAVAHVLQKFKVGMRLEAVDRRFPYFVCVATISNVREEGEEVLIHFDGWTEAYDYWCVSDSVELHPTGWCETHNWELQPPHGNQHAHTHVHTYMHTYIHTCIHTCI